MLVSPPRRLAVAVLLGGWCAVLVGVRMAVTGSAFGTFLAWNLVLAAVPLAASSWLVRLDRRGAGGAALVVLGAVWLLFFPNAPYILTDLVHLRPRSPVPFWYDLAVLLSAAGAGLLAGYVSLADVHDVVARRWGGAVGWASAVGALFLGAFGVYLGRVLRLNSWDVVTAPLGVARSVAGPVLNPGTHVTAVVVTLVFGGMLTAGYVALRAVAAPPVR